MWSGVTGTKYSNFLGEAINVDEMVLRGASKSMNKNGNMSAMLSSGNNKGLVWFRAEYQ